MSQLIMSAKPDWQSSEAKFLMNLIHKERQETALYEEDEGGFRPRFGSRNETSSPDEYMWRQRYLRSYTFTREEEEEEDRFGGLVKVKMMMMNDSRSDRRCRVLRQRFFLFFGRVKKIANSKAETQVLKMMSCNSSICVDVAVVDQITTRRSAKPEWDKSQTKFIINLRNIDKQRHEQLTASNPNKNISIFYEKKGGGFGSRNDTSSPDSYVWRQRFLRSYTFTREEDYLGRRRRRWW